MSCRIYEGHSAWSVTASLVLSVLIFLSYVPQLFTVAQRKSTSGISPYFLLLMNLGSTFAFSNVIVLSKPIFACCSTTIGVFDCIGSLAGSAQLFAGFLGPLILLVLALKYRDGGSQGRRIVWCAYAVVATNFLVWAFASSVSDRDASVALATGLGLSALAVGLVQYLPQLYTTYSLRDTGSLSITTMMIQIPGGYLWCLSLAMRKGSHWSTWISLFCAASLQLLLLLMALYFRMRAVADAELPSSPVLSPSLLPEEGPMPGEPDENAPLLD